MFDFYADDPEALKADLENLKTQARQAAEADAKYVPFATAAQQNADSWLGKIAEGGGGRNPRTAIIHIAFYQDWCMKNGIKTTSQTARVTELSAVT